MAAGSHSDKDRHNRTGPLQSNSRSPSPASKDQQHKQHHRSRSHHHSPYHSSHHRRPHYSSSKVSYSRIKSPATTLNGNPSTATPAPLVPHLPHLPPAPLVPEPSFSFNSPLSPSASVLPPPTTTSFTFTTTVTTTTTLIDITPSPVFLSLPRSGSIATTFVPSILSSTTLITDSPVPESPTNLAKISGSSSSTNLGIVLGIVIGGLALLGLLAVFWFRSMGRQRNKKEMMLQQDYSTARGGSARDATRRDGATSTGIARLTTASSPPMTSYRHEAFMTLVKEAAMGFYAAGLDQPPTTTVASSSSAESPAGANRPMTNSSERGGNEEEESVRRLEEGSLGSSDESSEGELQYLEVGSPRLAAGRPT
ncbi:hypothetical protein EMPS_01225 [Entomortierella parvispora]|uniref:Mid2 domain-containing protein n=1 Tax=Entomortierella parvispora TaxID=205924 RepID=A0A9P3H2G1_9FUNG|nr:hypothetical protein EMPS_01225 [Entomortierella parvispora]